MRRLIFIFTLLLFVQTVFAYNPFWVHIDKKLIGGIVQLDRNSPQTVEEYFRTQKIQKCDTTKENLGFGWKMWTAGIGGGYISITATFLYFHDSIVSYSIKPQLPVEKGLIEKYKTWYGDSFPFGSNGILPFNYRSDSILKPLSEYKWTLTPLTVSRKILDYMTPNSGTMYGYAGGYNGNLLQNRRTFNEIKDGLTNEQVIFLMYSINPASRFTAFEYYLKHEGRFQNQQSIHEWIEINFKEIPTVQTLFGCIGQSFETRALVEMYSLMEADK